jgi:hypothetical protein
LLPRCDPAFAPEKLPAGEKKEQHPRPLAPRPSGSSVRKGSGTGSSPAEQFHRSVWCNLVLPRRANRVAAGWPPPPALRSGGGTPAARKPGSAGSRPSSPRPPEFCLPRQHLQGPSDIAGSGMRREICGPVSSFGRVGRVWRDHG